MSAPGSGRGWAVRVPVGYRVGDWRVTAPIATGSFGSVYAARHASSGADAALKFIAAGRVGHRRELAEREAAFGRRARHDHLVAVVDTLTVDDPPRPFDGALVLVMERAAGSLQDRLDAAVPGRPLPGAPRIVAETCAGLAHLHAAGWVHGDVKPANILLTAGGGVRLADFGLVTALVGDHGYGPPLGSPDYQSPQRRAARLSERGVPVRRGDDVWALGVTAHRVLTGGCWPFPGDTGDARAAAARWVVAGRTPLRLCDGLPPAWRAFVATCLDPERERPTSELLGCARRLAEGPAPVT
ncbi:serine/threonine protein kinase [Micromonospora sp. PLK6-60]|uniref:serine/threonine-protein kinase n=1 Tax=Micromonospora sp. PLK6-60 TaxID=2873383 RepID=UPI001CA74301|nr:serine/threonine-protein kinase [Micromonospora sp. PLK6-60]MBY8871332.1 serine/threonine protein kinase [Micromonospora sp. PLK6-60]